MTNTLERRKNFLFTRDYLFGAHAILTRDDGKFLSRLKDFSGHKVAVVRDYIVHRKLKQEFPTINLLVVDNDRQALEAVATGKAEACVEVISVATFMIQKYGLTNLKIAAPAPFSENRDAMAVRYDWPELVSIIDKGFAAMLPDEHNRIRQKTFSMRFEYGISWLKLFTWILGVTLVLGFFLAVFVAANRRLEREIAERKRVEAERERLIFELREALAEVKTLRGFIPICSQCKKIRDDSGYWQRLEEFLKEHSEAQLSHGLCPDCAKGFLMNG